MLVRGRETGRPKFDLHVLLVDCHQWHRNQGNTPASHPTHCPGSAARFCYRSLFLPKHCSTRPYRLVSEAGKNKEIVSYTVMRDTKLVYRTCVVVNCHQSCPSLPTIKQYCLSNCNTKRGKKKTTIPSFQLSHVKLSCDLSESTNRAARWVGS